jgi:hypothetical protein
LPFHRAIIAFDDDQSDTSRKNFENDIDPRLAALLKAVEFAFQSGLANVDGVAIA